RGEGEPARDPVELRDDGVGDRTVRGIEEGLHAFDLGLGHRGLADGPQVFPVRLQPGDLPLDLPVALPVLLEEAVPLLRLGPDLRESLEDPTAQLEVPLPDPEEGGGAVMDELLMAG